MKRKYFRKCGYCGKRLEQKTSRKERTMSDRLLNESDVLQIAFQLPDVVNSAFFDAVKALPSADRPQGKWETAGEKFKYIRCPYCKTARASSRARFCDWCGAQMKGADDD